MDIIDELVCLNRQVVYREACRHQPTHPLLADLIVRKFAPNSPKDVQTRIRAACAPRR